MQPDFYDAYFRATEHSPIHSAFCRHVFGLDLCQHGFTDVGQLRLAIQTAPIRPDHCILDIGCGNGMITEYLSDQTGARSTGVDNAAVAIELAIKRTGAKADRL
jgi:SAM-dependent methyltransferase